MSTTIRRSRKNRGRDKDSGGKKEFRKNEEIRVPEVFLIDDANVMRGVMPTSEALSIAQSVGLDLVEVSPQAKPPVVKIIDFGKLQYEKAKQDRKNRSAAKKVGDIKGIRLTVKIGDHDMMVRVKAGQKFLDKGDKVKVELQLRGREKAHPDIAKEVMKKYIELLEREVVLEQDIKRQGGRFSAIVSLKKK